MFDVSREEITGGKLSRAMILLAAPMVAQQIVVALGAVVDIFWLGRLNEPAVAAVGLVVPVYGLLSIPVIATYTGGQILTSQSVGADDRERARRIPLHAVQLGVLVALVLAVVVVERRPARAECVDDPRRVVDALGASGATFDYAVVYLTTYMFAFVPMAVSDGLEGGFVGWGDSGVTFGLNVANILVNAALDPLLIFGVGPFPRWEVFGAAVASIVGVSTSAALALGIAASGRRSFSLSRAALTISGSLYREILEVGLPVGLQNAGRQAARLGMVVVIAYTGSTAGLAAYNVGAQIATLAFVPAQGLASASTTIVGQNLGADRPDRARRATWFGAGTAVTVLLVFGGIQWLAPSAIAETFAPALGGDALALSIDYLRILAIGYWALGAIYTFESGFNGASRTSVSMYATLVQYWGVRLPIAVLGAFVLDFGVHAAFWGVTLSNVAAAVGLAVFFYYSTDRGMLERAATEASVDAAD
jgi:putative MATE family efflux protein